MATTASPEHAEHAEHADEAHADTHADSHDHPTERKYWVIAGILAVITGVEVALSYIDLGDAVAPLLLLGMAMKFFIVAAYFMHLKFDSRVTRRLFLSGLFLALSCYIALFMMFRAFGPRPDRQDIKIIQTGQPQ